MVDTRLKRDREAAGPKGGEHEVRPRAPDAAELRRISAENARKIAKSLKILAE